MLANVGKWPTAEDPRSMRRQADRGARHARLKLGARADILGGAGLDVGRAMVPTFTVNRLAFSRRQHGPGQTVLTHFDRGCPKDALAGLKRVDEPHQDLVALPAARKPRIRRLRSVV